MMPLGQWPSVWGQPDENGERLAVPEDPSLRMLGLRFFWSPSDTVIVQLTDFGIVIHTRSCQMDGKLAGVLIHTSCSSQGAKQQCLKCQLAWELPWRESMCS